MKLQCFKTLWGNRLPIELACDQAITARFNGIEGQAPVNKGEQQHWKAVLDAKGCHYVAEVVTGGDYVPQRNKTPQQHLDDLRIGIENSLPLNPLFVTSLAGCDAWEENQSIDFFQAAIELGETYHIQLSFETHRSRPTFNPWSTLRIAKALPEMRFTADISHWCVVCERLMDSEMDTLTQLIPQIYHVHARVGYDQGPQVPDPRAPEYRTALHSHLGFWRRVWFSQFESGRDIVTMTPEFGPDGYCHLQPYTQMPVVDIWEVNQWMGQRLRQEFSESLAIH